MWMKNINEDFSSLCNGGTLDKVEEARRDFQLLFVMFVVNVDIRSSVFQKR